MTEHLPLSWVCNSLKEYGLIYHMIASEKEEGMTTYSLLQYGTLSEDYKRKTNEYHDHYVKIEFDPHVDHETKFDHMVEWWRKSNQALVDERATLKDIVDSVYASNIKFRENSDYFFKTCDSSNIPILVFSAGISQVIEDLFHAKSCLHDNIHIISNDLIINDKQIIVGLSDPVIHSLNKGERSRDLLKEKESTFYKQNRHRRCILLLGDTIGDTHMSDGFTDIDVVLKIGFLNSNVDVLYEKYKSVFDVLITNDGPMDYINDILLQILQKK